MSQPHPVKGLRWICSGCQKEFSEPVKVCDECQSVVNEIGNIQIFAEDRIRIRE